MKLHFYKQGTAPELPGLRYADASRGIWGYLSPQSLKWYLGYKDIQTMENELKQAKTDARNGIRGRRTVRQSFSSRY